MIQSFWRSQFDKMLIAFLVILFSGLAFLAASNESVRSFALQSAAGTLGCLITLVTGRRPTSPDPSIEPTSGSTSTTTISKTETVAPPPAAQA